MAEDVTLGELNRSLQEFKQEMQRRFTSIDHRLDSMTFVSKEVYEADMRARDDRISTLEARAEEDKRNRQKLVYGAIGGFIWPVLVAMFLAAVLTR